MSSYCDDFSFDEESELHEKVDAQQMVAEEMALSFYSELTY